MHDIAIRNGRIHRRQRRFMQRPRGYCATLCAGQVVLEEDEVTGALAGRLVRRTRQ